MKPAGRRLIATAAVAATTVVGLSIPGASGRAAPVATRAAGTASVSETTTTGTSPVAALATDQACSRHAPPGSTLATSPYRPDDLAAMTIPKSGFGTATRSYSIEWSGSGYTDNAEVWQMMTRPQGACALNHRYGRITGFAGAYWGAQTVDSAVHLFFTTSGAAGWLKAYVAGMKALVGRDGIVSVRVSDVPVLGPGAVKVTDQCSDGCVTTRVFFLRGPLVGSVRDSHRHGSAPVVRLVSTAQELAARMTARTATVSRRGQDPADAVMMLSAGPPKALLGSRYSGLVWDWYYGGCWTAAEAAQQTTYAADRRQFQADAAKYGMLSFCRAMYVPPGTRLAVNGVQRVFNGGFLYATATGAHHAMAAIADQWAARAGRTDGGMTYGPLHRFGPGPVGDEAVGLQQRYGSLTVTRAYFRRGRYLAVDALVASTPYKGMVVDVRRWASRLDARVTSLLSNRTF